MDRKKGHRQRFLFATAKGQPAAQVRKEASTPPASSFPLRQCKPQDSQTSPQIKGKCWTQMQLGDLANHRETKGWTPNSLYVSLVVGAERGSFRGIDIHGPRLRASADTEALSNILVFNLRQEIITFGADTAKPKRGHGRRLTGH